MKKLQLFSALLLSATLAACGGGDPESASDKPNNLLPDDFVPPASSSSSSSSASNIVNETIPFHENFDNAVNTRGFFSADYKALNTDTELPFYYATGGFLDEEGNPSPTATSWITADDNRKLQIGNGRFTLGQTRLEAGTTTADASIPTWGEFDLSKPYKLSFCVVQVSSPSGSNFEVYVDNNTTGGNNSRYGAGNASRILQVATHTLVPGQRQEVTVPATEGGTLIGTETSFFQFRVSSGGWAVVDDVVVEYVGEPHGLSLPDCVAEESTPPEPEAPPVAPAAPNLIAGDGQITVTWSSVGINTTYQVFYNTMDSTEGAIPFAGNPVDGTSALITGLINDTTYYVFIRAENAVGLGEFSVSSSATPVAPTVFDTDYEWVFNPVAYQNEENFFAAAFDAGGNNNLVTSDEIREVDGLLIFLSNGTALRYRGNDNRWNFNGHSWSGGSSVLAPAVGEDVAELRAFLGVPIDAGRSVTLEFTFQQSSSGAVAGKVMLIGSDNKLLAVMDANNGTDPQTITYSAPEGHTLSHVKVAYSREGDSTGGAHINGIVKTYGDGGDPAAEDKTWGYDIAAYQEVDTDLFESAFDIEANDNRIKAMDDVDGLPAPAVEVDGLRFYSRSAGVLRFRVAIPAWNTNGSFFTNNATLLPAVGEDLPTNVRTYIDVPVVSGEAVDISISYSQTSSGITAGKLAFVGSDNKLLAAQDADFERVGQTLSYSLTEGHSLTHVRIIYGREGSTSGGVNITEISREYQP